MQYIGAIGAVELAGTRPAAQEVLELCPVHQVVMVAESRRVREVQV